MSDWQGASPRAGVELSVVIPCYREGARVGATMADVTAFLEGFGRGGEVVVVDDGSDDDTADVVRAWVGKKGAAPVSLLRHPTNRGKGAAVRTGLGAARGRWRLMMDADSSTRVSEVEGLLAVARSTGAGLVAGSRRAADARVTARAMRRATGAIFRGALWALGLDLLSDTQCGFKLYREDVARAVCDLGREDRFAFDLEHLLIARSMPGGVAEAGVVWEHRDGGTVRPVRDGLAMLRSAARLRASGVGAAARARGASPGAGCAG